MFFYRRTGKVYVICGGLLSKPICGEEDEAKQGLALAGYILYLLSELFFLRVCLSDASLLILYLMLDAMGWWPSFFCRGMLLFDRLYLPTLFFCDIPTDTLSVAAFYLS